MDILDILKKHGIEIPEDKRSDFNKDFQQNYKTAGDYKKIKDNLAELQKSIEGHTDLEGRLSALQKKYDTDIAERDKRIGELNFDSKLSNALNGIEFSNSRVRNSIITEIKSKNFKVSDNGEIEGLQDYLKGLYGTEPESFKAVDSGIHTWYGGSSNSSEPIKQVSDIFNTIH